MTKIAVIGAGVSGSVCARLLADEGFHVEVFEKSRGAGGRLATRKTEHSAYDHGMPFIAPDDKRMRRRMEKWVNAGLLQSWTSAEGERQLVAVPSMSQLCASLLEGVPVHVQTRIGLVQWQVYNWRLFREDGEDLGEYDKLILAMPGPQVAELLAEFPTLTVWFDKVRYRPNWTLFADFTGPVAGLADINHFQEGIVAHAYRNSAKPERLGDESWVVHASQAWSQEHLEDAPEEVQQVLLAAFAELSGGLPMAREVLVHRWRYAEVERGLDIACIFDPGMGLGACGDWCSGGKLAGAIISGEAAAKSIILG